MSIEEVGPRGARKGMEGAYEQGAEGDGGHGECERGWIITTPDDYEEVILACSEDNLNIDVQFASMPVHVCCSTPIGCRCTLVCLMCCSTSSPASTHPISSLPHFVYSVLLGARRS